MGTRRVAHSWRGSVPLVPPVPSQGPQERDGRGVGPGPGTALAVRGGARATRRAVRVVRVVRVVLRVVGVMRTSLAV
ncbi:hypothetical protein SHKM778_77090 [Streptomyces sp. KM77-8]|uniref:Uncharacterized protein n=1 Tax=Streptomyces haneummycinicus TaxID=3074435 RepID=A0AAT9HVA4_9ACTN